MALAEMIWERLRAANRIPGALSLYRTVMRVVLGDGKVRRIVRGPLAGLKWLHRKEFQPWMALGLYEPHVARLLSEVIRSGDVFYDVGANAGYYTLLAASRVGPTGFVLSFDPHPLNGQTVREQLRINDLHGVVEFVQAAVADRDGELTFRLSTTNANSHLVDHRAPGLAQTGESITVPAIALSSFARTHRKPTIIKMDIEGAEVVALRGAAELLSATDAPVLLVSTHSAELDRQCKEILLSHGYRFANLEGFGQMIHALPPHPREVPR